MDNDTTLLTVDDICRVLGIGRSTLYNWRKRNHGPAHVYIGPPSRGKKRLVRYRQTDLLEFIGGNHGR